MSRYVRRRGLFRRLLRSCRDAQPLRAGRRLSNLQSRRSGSHREAKTTLSMIRSRRMQGPQVRLLHRLTGMLKLKRVLTHWNGTTNIESGRRSLAGPKHPAVSAVPQKPACPYEKCEPGWGENLGIFKPSLHSKAGRIEKIPNDMTTLPNGSQNMTGGESVLWINNWCYNILVSPDPQRRGMYKCFFPLGKTATARGDLFDHMDDSRPPQSHYTDAPWISYGLSIGVSHDRRTAP